MICLSHHDRTIPQSKIALSRLNRTMLGFGQASTEKKGTYLAKINRFKSFGRPPQSKSALSRRDRTILGFGKSPQRMTCLSRYKRTIQGFGKVFTRQNRLISPKQNDFRVWVGVQRAKPACFTKIGLYKAMSAISTYRYNEQEFGKPLQSQIASPRQDGFGVCVGLYRGNTYLGNIGRFKSLSRPLK